MRRICVALIIVVLSGSVCYGAVSEDREVYLRKDVFDAKMEVLFSRLHGEIQALAARIDGLDAKLSERIDGNFATLSSRIDGLDARMSDLRNGLYLGLVLFGTVIALFAVVIAMPFFSKWQEERQKKKEARRQPSFTLDDVRRLIEENNAELRRSLQV